jgi:hypothetical protein
MSNLEIDLRNAIDGSADNFTCLLMRLMIKSDTSNFAKLKSIYPKEAELVEAFKLGTRLRTTSHSRPIINPNGGIDIKA